MNKSFFIIFLALIISCKKSTDAVISTNYDNLQISNNNAKNSFIEGMKEIQNENFEQAKIFFEKSNSFERNNVTIMNGLANTVNILGEIDKAENLYKYSLKIDSSYISTYENYGNFLNEQKRFEESNVILMKGLNKNPPSSQKIGLYLNLSLIMKKQHNCSLAKKYAGLAMENCQKANIYRTDIVDFINELKDCK